MSVITFSWTLIYPMTWTVGFLHSREETKLLEWKGNRLKNICLRDLSLKVKSFTEHHSDFVEKWRSYDEVEFTIFTLALEFGPEVIIIQSILVNL